MTRTNKKYFLFVLVLLTSGLAFFVIITSVNASSETFPLIESASVSRVVNANVGDRIVGDFTIYNIPTWIEPYTGNPKTVEYEFKIVKIEGTYDVPQDITVFEVAQTAHSSFDITCAYTGNYRLRFNVGSGNPSATGIGTAKATLNYQVIKPTPIPTPNNESLFGKMEITPAILAGIVTSVLILVGYSVYYLVSSRKRRNLPKVS